MRKMFKDFHEAWSFCTGKEGAAVRVCGDEWEATWTGERTSPEPEPPSAFERIVSRNGGEPMDHRGDALAYSQFDYARNTKSAHSDAPAEIVQRLKVKTIGQYTASDFHVDLCEVKKPHRMVSFRVTEADTSRFKVGSVIEVVLRPAPLA